MKFSIVETNYPNPVLQTQKPTVNFLQFWKKKNLKIKELKTNEQSKKLKEKLAQSNPTLQSQNLKELEE